MSTWPPGTHQDVQDEVQAHRDTMAYRFRGKDNTSIGLATGSFLQTVSNANIAGEMEYIRAANAGTVRADLPWSVVETSQGVYDWSKPDAIFDAADASGLKVLFTITGSPAWSRTAGEPSISYGPTDPATLASFCTAAVNRYKNRGGFGCHWWEIWNEPNVSAQFGTPTDVAKYVSMIGAAYPAVHAADPTARVILGSILRGGRESWTTQILDTTWLQYAYTAGISGKFDVLGYHPYSTPASPADTTATGQPTGANLVTNGTFDTNTTGWASDNSTPTRVTSGQRTGAGALQLTANGAGVTRGYYANAVVTAGTYYLATAWVYTTTAEPMNISIDWSNSGFTYLSTDDGDTITTYAGQWTQLGLRVTAPAGAAFATVKVQTTGTSPNGRVYVIDDVALNTASGTDNGWNRITLMRALMVANGDAGKPIWFTEVGQATGTATGAVSEDVQATYVTAALRRFQDFPYAEKLFWYMYRDTGTNLADVQSNYGLLRNDYSQKAGYVAFKAGATLRPDETLSTTQFTTTGAWATWTKPYGASMIHIFAVSGGGGGGGGATGAAGTARGGGGGGAGGNTMRVSFAASVVPDTLYAQPGAGGAGGAAGATGSVGSRSYVSIAQNTTASNLFIISGATDTAAGVGGTSSGSAAGGTASGVPSTSLATFLSLGAYVGTGGNGGASGGNATGTAGGAITPLNGVATAPGSGGGATGTGNVDTAGGAQNAVGPLAGVAGGVAGGGAGNPGVSSAQPFCASGGSGGGSSGASGTGGVGGAGIFGTGGGGGGAGVTGGAGGKGGDGIVIIVATR